MYIVDRTYCYTLSHSSKGKESGMLLYDINNYLSEEDKDTHFTLDNVQVGINGVLDWNIEYSRLSYLKNFN